MEDKATQQPAFGHTDGENLGNGEMVVYDYDDDELVGWHKELTQKDDK